MPEPVPTEIRVRVAAAGVNAVDWKTRAGDGVSGLLGAPPFVLGWDVAGVVDAVGFGTVLANVTVGVNPIMVAVLQDGTRAYVANAGNTPCTYFVVTVGPPEP